MRHDPEITPIQARVIIVTQCTAEMLGLPERVCRHRVCRRSRACRHHSLDLSKPACVGHLDPREYDIFDRLVRMAAEIHDGTLWPCPSKDPERRELEEAAIAIVRAALPKMPDITRTFHDWCRRYATPPAPQEDTRALLRDMRAELVDLGITEANPKV